MGRGKNRKNPIEIVCSADLIRVIVIRRKYLEEKGIVSRHPCVSIKYGSRRRMRSRRPRQPRALRGGWCLDISNCTVRVVERETRGICG